MPQNAPSKPYDLTMEHRNGYLYAYVQGDNDSYEISRAFWTEIADEVRRTNAARVLIDENIEQSVSMAEVFQLASELPKMGFGSARVAFVDRYLDQQEINAFGELVAVNRGFSGKLFNNVAEAESWLIGS
jgi:hypothetical protein